MRAVLLRVVMRQFLLEVHVGRWKLSEPEQGLSQRPVGFQQEGGVLATLGETEELRPECVCGPQLRAQDISTYAKVI
jgi:hypothetical protein